MDSEFPGRREARPDRESSERRQELGFANPREQIVLALGGAAQPEEKHLILRAAIQAPFEGRAAFAFASHQILQLLRHVLRASWARACRPWVRSSSCRRCS